MSLVTNTRKINTLLRQSRANAFALGHLLSSILESRGSSGEFRDYCVENFPGLTSRKALQYIKLYTTMDALGYTPYQAEIVCGAVSEKDLLKVVPNNLETKIVNKSAFVEFVQKKSEPAPRKASTRVSIDVTDEKWAKQFDTILSKYGMVVDSAGKRTGATLALQRLFEESKTLKSNKTKKQAVTA
jgi:hypothetical protein